MTPRERALQAVRATTPSPAGTAWAHKILARHRRGEKMPSLSLAWAREVVSERPAEQPATKKEKSPWDD